MNYDDNRVLFVPNITTLISYAKFEEWRGWLEKTKEERRANANFQFLLSGKQLKQETHFSLPNVLPPPFLCHVTDPSEAETNNLSHPFKSISENHATDRPLTLSGLRPVPAIKHKFQTHSSQPVLAFHQGARNFSDSGSYSPRSHCSCSFQAVFRLQFHRFMLNLAVNLRLNRWFVI